MVAVVAGELSPIVTGLIYCNTIAFCQDALELRRAREWTDALAEWCERQPDMVAHTGVCLVHRAEILELAGDWDVALEEARRAGERFDRGSAAAGHAVYRQAEVHRVRGELAAAEQAYRDASRCGFEPQPGLALLRLAQGREDAAASAIRRALSEATDPLRRLRLLPAVRRDPARHRRRRGGANGDARARAARRAPRQRHGAARSPRTPPGPSRSPRATPARR